MTNLNNARRTISRFTSMLSLVRQVARRRSQLCGLPALVRASPCLHHSTGATQPPLHTASSVRLESTSRPRSRPTCNSMSSSVASGLSSYSSMASTGAGPATALADAAPDLYTIPPPSPHGERKPGQLEQWQVKQYFEDGFLVVPNFFAPEELAPVCEAVDECVDVLANRLYDGGKIADKCKDAGFYKRLTLLEKQFKGTAVLLHKMGALPPAFRQLWANERLLNVVEQFIGPNIAGNPVWNLRTKTPSNEQTTVPWHQDNSYFDPSALHTLMPTAWIPLIDANTTNGCMQVVRGGHRKGVTATHTCCAGGTWYVDLSEEEMVKTLGVDMERDVCTCEVPYGGVLLLNNAVPHRSLENFSNDVRWSLDLRWQVPDKPNGFYGLKDSVLMRSEADPTLEIDWEEFALVDRTRLQERDVGWESEGAFDTTIHGPWMRRWEIVHHNKHTASLLKQSDSIEIESSWHPRT